VAQIQSAWSSNREASPGIAIQGTEEGIKASKKRHKQCHQEATTDDNGGINEQAGNASVEHATTVVGNSKHQARPPTDHFQKLLEQSCPNHTYAVKHKLWDYSLIKSFMAAGSLPRGTKVVEALIEDDVTPFPREDAVMMVFGRSSPPEKHHALNPCIGAPSYGDHIWGDEEMQGQ
jgi:hypothetical protein